MYKKPDSDGVAFSISGNIRSEAVGAGSGPSRGVLLGPPRQTRPRVGAAPPPAATGARHRYVLTGVFTNDAAGLGVPPRLIVADSLKEDEQA